MRPLGKALPRRTTADSSVAVIWLLQKWSCNSSSACCSRERLSNDAFDLMDIIHQREKSGQVREDEEKMWGSLPITRSQALSRPSSAMERDPETRTQGKANNEFAEGLSLRMIFRASAALHVRVTIFHVDGIE